MSAVVPPASGTPIGAPPAARVPAAQVPDGVTVPAQPRSAGAQQMAPAPGGLHALVRLADRGAPVLGFVAVLVLWELACRLVPIPAFILPAPTAIARGFTEIAPSVWFGHVWATLRVALMGYLLAIAVSIPLAVMLANSRLLSRTLLPMLVVVQSTPVVAIAPIIVVTMGAGDLPRVVITFLITFFPIVVSTATGLHATPPELVELSRSLRASRSRQMLHVRLPFAMPYVFASLKIATTLAVIGAVVGEFVAAERGLGFLILFSTQFFKIHHAFAALIMLVAISLGLFKAVGLLQQRYMPWSLPSGR
jgi:NitT/TauT family transport system permease protein